MNVTNLFFETERMFKKDGRIIILNSIERTLYNININIKIIIFLHSLKHIDFQETQTVLSNNFLFHFVPFPTVHTIKYIYNEYFILFLVELYLI